MKLYYIEYKNKGDYSFGEEIEAPSEHLAMIKLVEILLSEDDYISRLDNITEITPELKEHLKN